MATPFSPFVGRPAKPILKRRQSELPSDLIDWDAPEIPELEKQRIIYEDHIREIQEDHEIEDLLNEQIFKVAHETVVNQYQSMVKKLENDVTEGRSKINLLLAQIKMFETNVNAHNERVDELEKEMSAQRNTIISLEQEKEVWSEERNTLEMEIENLNFRNNEIACELTHNTDIAKQMKTEVGEYQKKLLAIKSQLKFYKNLAKNKDNVEE